MHRGSELLLQRRLQTCQQLWFCGRALQDFSRITDLFPVARVPVSRFSAGPLILFFLQPRKILYSRGVASVTWPVFLISAHHGLHCFCCHCPWTQGRELAESTYGSRFCFWGLVLENVGNDLFQKVNKMSIQHILCVGCSCPWS